MEFIPMRKDGDGYSAVIKAKVKLPKNSTPAEIGKILWRAIAGSERAISAVD
jgi:hypothetical protein